MSKSKSALKIPAWLQFPLYKNITRFLKCLNEVCNIEEEKQCTKEEKQWLNYNFFCHLANNLNVYFIIWFSILTVSGAFYFQIGLTDCKAEIITPLETKIILSLT